MQWLLDILRHMHTTCTHTFPKYLGLWGFGLGFLPTTLVSEKSRMLSKSRIKKCKSQEDGSSLRRELFFRHLSLEEMSFQKLFQHLVILWVLREKLESQIIQKMSLKYITRYQDYLSLSTSLICALCYKCFNY